MRAHARLGVVRGQPVDHPEVDGSRREVARSGTSDEVLGVAKAAHQSVEDRGGGGDGGDVGWEGVA